MKSLSAGGRGGLRRRGRSTPGRSRAEASSIGRRASAAAVANLGCCVLEKQPLQQRLHQRRYHRGAWEGCEKRTAWQG